MITIQITNEELDLLKSGLSARRKRCNGRIINENNRRQKRIIPVEKSDLYLKRINEIDSLYSKLSECNIS